MAITVKEKEASQDALNKEAELKEVLVSVRRVTKVAKGGRRFSFSVLMIVGDGKGNVGYGLGKAKEVTEARTKATQDAKKSMIKVPLKANRTLHHDIIGHFGAGKVLIRTAKAGTGVIAGGPLRPVFEALGVHDVVAKSLGSSNVHNMLGAAFDALRRVTTPKLIAAKRNKKIGEIIDENN